ncbi:MAG: alkaline phosphatase [Propionicimonas sp.]
MSSFRTPLRVSLIGATTLLLLGGAVAAAAPARQPQIRDLSATGGARQNDGDRTKQVRRAVDGGRARNVILLIGDGMGDSEITIARNYVHGAAGRFKGIDALPLTGQYTTYSLYPEGHAYAGKPDYDPDSAATGTAWATGTKSYDGAISVDLRKKPKVSLLELAKANGFKTGNVSTAELQDATPAVESAHVSTRRCYGPDDTKGTVCPTDAVSAGGLGSISEQIVKTRADVTLGGGAASFNDVIWDGGDAGKTVLQQAKAAGYQVATTEAELNRIRTTDQKKPLLGLFHDGNMDVRWNPTPAVPGGTKAEPVQCTVNQDWKKGTAPTLAEMTSKAIDLLKSKSRYDRGFFLQVEGASIDKQDHAANACGQIGETVDLDEAVQVALEFAKRDGNTSVFVTADHAHTSQIVEVGSTTPGIGITLLTADNAPMAVLYGTSPEGGSQQHTGTQLRVAGYGPGAANIVGLTDQTDLHFTIRAALGLKEKRR